MKVYIYLFSYNSFVCFFFCIPNRISYKSLELQWANICTLSLKLQYLWSKVKVYCCLHILICITIYFHKFFIFKCVSIIQLNVHLNFWIIYRVLDFNISLDMQESPSNNDKISISIQTVETKRRNHLSEGFQFEHKFVYIFFSNHPRHIYWLFSLWICFHRSQFQQSERNVSNTFLLAIPC